MERCLICDEKNISKKLNVGKYALYECHSCSVVCTFPQGNTSNIRQNNAKQYDSADEEKEYLNHYTRLSKRAAKFIREIQRVKKSGKLLDIGCSYGIYLAAAQKAGFEVYGVEIAKRAIAYVRKKLGFPVFHGALEEARYDSHTFDVITAYDVIEHIPNITLFLSEVRRVLKKDGIFIVQCPNIESVVAKLLGKHWNWLVVPNHLWHFSPKSLSYVLSLSGFTVLFCRTWDDIDDFADNILYNGNNRTTKKTSLKYKLTKRALAIFIFLTSYAWCRLGKGGAIRTYAIKN